MNHSESENTLREAGSLVGKIVYNDTNVFRRLRISDVDDDLVAVCAHSFEQQNKREIERLVNLDHQASMKLKQVRKQEADEMVEVHKLLVEHLCGYITSFGGGTTQHRRVQKSRSMLKPDEYHDSGFTKHSPYLTFTKPGIDASDSNLWRDRDAFLEVKPSRNQRPKEKDGRISKILLRSAHDARLFMSARPFMLFCVGILVFGTEFCVGIFDQDGITLSPIYDLFKNVPCFIRVIRSVSHGLSSNELGSDPTVRVLSLPETERLTGRMMYYPSAVVSPIGDDVRKWCTIGPPLWSASTFLSRGTNLWRVRQCITANGTGQPFLQGDEMIMKTAWRSSHQLPECDIYRSVQPPPKGLATFECGGDVYLDGWPITVQNLQSRPVVHALPENDDTQPTPVLHRLILRTVGRPMWQYTSELDLLTGFRDALFAHKELCQQGILHRDVNPGNVLLAANQNESSRGFITDLGLARIESDTITVRDVVETVVGPQRIQNYRGNPLPDCIPRTPPVVRTHTTFKTVDVKRGAEITGTVQFMARELLRPAISMRAQQIPHQVNHDIQSFIWVFSYCVMHRLYLLSLKHKDPAVHQQHKAFGQIFFRAFNQTGLYETVLSRGQWSPALVFPELRDVQSLVKTLMSQTLIDVFEGLDRLISNNVSENTNRPLTHELLLEVVNNAIESLTQSTIA